MRPYPPLGILYISAYLEDQGIQNEVFDTTFSSKKAFRAYLLTYKPKLIGIYVNLMTKLNVLETIRFVKEHLTETTIILGGPEVRYSAENFLRYGADYIVIGEGEETMTELVNSLILVPANMDDDSPGLADSTSRKSIAGIAFLETVSGWFETGAQLLKKPAFSMVSTPAPFSLRHQFTEINLQKNLSNNEISNN